MKTTLDIPDSLYRETKATAALRGESVKDFVTAAIEARLRQITKKDSGPTGWRRVFARASSDEVREVDGWIGEEFGHVDLDDWK